MASGTKTPASMRKKAEGNHDKCKLEEGIADLRKPTIKRWLR